MKGKITQIIVCLLILILIIPVGISPVQASVGVDGVDDEADNEVTTNDASTSNVNGQTAFKNQLQAAYAVTETRISNAAGDQLYPKFFSNMIIWEDYRNSEETGCDIYMYDLNHPELGEQLICNSPGDQFSVSASGNIIVWQDTRNMGSTGYDIYMYDLNNPVPNGQVVCNAPGDQISPMIDGNTIIWQDERNVNVPYSSGVDIYMYNLNSPVPNGQAVCDAPDRQEYPSIHGNFIVWDDYREGWKTGADIYLYDLSNPVPNGQAICIASGDQWMPDIDGNTIVWEDNRNYGETGWDIYAYDLNNPVSDGQLICNSPGNQEHAYISGDTIIWGNNDAETGWDIYAYDLSNPVPNGQVICNALGDQNNFCADGSIIVWQDGRNLVSGTTGYDIYMYDLNTPVPNGQVVCNATHIQEYPSIHGSFIVWDDVRGGMMNGADIYMAEISTTPIVDLSPPMVESTTPESFYWTIDSYLPTPTVTFNEPIDPTSLAGATFTLVDQIGSHLTATLTLTTPNVVQCDPGQLGYGTYTATISGVRDLAGNAMAAPYTWQFARVSGDVSIVDPFTTSTPVTNTLSSDGSGKTIKVDFPSFNRATMDQAIDPNDPTTTTEFDVLSIKGLGMSHEVGKPSLPVYSTVLGVPDDVPYTVRIIEASTLPVEGYNVYPAQESASGTSPQPPFAYDEAFYLTEEPYPESFVNIGGTVSFRDYTGLPIDIYPVQFEPSSRTLLTHKSVTLQLELADQPSGTQNTLPNWEEVTYGNDNGCDLLIITDESLTEPVEYYIDRKQSQGWKVKASTIQQIEETFANSGPTPELRIRSYIQYEYDNSWPKPSYLLIFGDDHLVPTFHRSIHWRTTGEELDYVHYEKVGTDIYYTILHGELDDLGCPEEYWSPDLAEGRIPVNNADEAWAVINKIIDYEDKLGNYPAWDLSDTATVVSYFLDGDYENEWEHNSVGDPDGKEDMTHIYDSEQTYDFLIDKGFNVERLYTVDQSKDPPVNPQYMKDSFNIYYPLPSELLKPNYPWDADKQDIIDSFNDGRFLVMYRGHGSAGPLNRDGAPPNGWTQGPQFTVDDVQELNNYLDPTIVTAFTCEAGFFDSATDYYQPEGNPSAESECIAEELLKKSGGGAAGVIAASRISATKPNTALAFGCIHAIWPEFLMTEQGLLYYKPVYRMGDVLNSAKMFMDRYYYADVPYFEPDYSTSSYLKSVPYERRLEYEMFHYFGDPTMAIKIPNLAEKVMANPTVNDIYVREGSIAHLSATQSLALLTADTPDNRITSYEWDLDSDNTFEVAGKDSLVTLYDDYSSPVTLQVTDAYGNVDTAVTRLTVLNVAPTVEAGQDLTVNNGMLEFNGGFTDPGTDDTWTYSLNFGDGSPLQTGSALQTAPLMAQAMSDGVPAMAQAGVQATHTYPGNGVYTVTLTVTDDDGGVGTDTMTVTVENTPSIAIDKVTNGADGQNILVGSPVTWTYTVTNTGAMPMSNVAITDNKGIIPAYVSGDANGNSILDLDEAWIYNATGTATAGSYENTGTATGTYEATTVTASDTSSYFGADPQIAIAKSTDDTDGKTILVGSPVTWTYTVTNNGNIPLSNIAVTDNITGVTPAYKSGDANNDGKLDLAEAWIYEASGTASVGSYANTGTASGSFTDSLGTTRTCTASDTSSYFGADPQIALVKVTNGADGNVILVGSHVTWTYTVTNAGNVPLSNVQVVDDKSVTPAYKSGDTNNDGKLGLAEAWIFEATGTAAYGSYANTGTASGSFTDDFGNTGTDTATDTSGYFGTLVTCTQGGYAGKGAPGKLLNMYYGTAFPSGLEIGQYTATTGYGDLWTSATGLKSFLTNAGTPGNITKDALNPTSAKNGGGTLASQTAALTINVAFSGLAGTNMPAGYGSLFYVSPSDLLNGKTVTEIHDAANTALGTGVLPAGYTYGSLTALIENLNEAFDNGVPTTWARDHLKSSP